MNKIDFAYGCHYSSAGDLSNAERLSIFAEALRIEQHWYSGTLNQYRAQFGNTTVGKSKVYLVFLEDSTRTKESFRAAAQQVLGMEVVMFDCGQSSINKRETYLDTFKMLAGYQSEPGVFVVRSKVEGVTKAISRGIAEYYSYGLSTSKTLHALPVFLNAGDGCHEHPTQELLDQYTFYAQLKGQTDSIHIALIGDLKHGRTIHSKMEGLRLFRGISVDLVAPDALQLPESYVEYMSRVTSDVGSPTKFCVRRFVSLQDYVSSGSRVASIWYMSRIQLERIDFDSICAARPSATKEQITSEWRRATSIGPNGLATEALKTIPGLKIYHPLPRFGLDPEIPFELDRTDYNGYFKQSVNGIFTRAALIKFMLEKRQPECALKLKELFGAANAIPGAVIPGVSPQEQVSTAEFKCSNTSCITHPASTQFDIPPAGISLEKTRGSNAHGTQQEAKCVYCDWPGTYTEVASEMLCSDEASKQHSTSSTRDLFERKAVGA